MNSKSRSGQSHEGDIEEGRGVSLPVDNYKFPFDWNIVTASDVANFARGISWSKAEETSKDKGIFVISIPNIKDGWIDYDSKFNHYLAKEVPKGKLLNIGDIVFVGSSGSVHNVGRNAQVKTLHNESVAFASFTFKACPKRDKIDEEFLYFLVNSDMVPFPDFCKRAADGKFNFQLRDFSSRLRIPLPPLPEQKKIAHILSTVQRAIEAQERIIQTTTELFKSMLHQLMTAQIRVSNGERIEGDSSEYRDVSLPVDNYKFPFDWNIVTASDVANFTRGVSWSKAEETSKDKGISVISIPNIKDGWIDYDSKFNHYLAKEVPKGKLLNIGDIAFVGSSGSVHNVGRNAQVKTLHNESVAFASFTFKACPKRDKIDEEFLYFLVNSDMVPFPDFCKRAADGKFNFQLRDFSSRLRIPLPPLPEQKKIAHILSTIQQKVDNAQSKKSKLQSLFRTLLHELMTAKIRVHEITL